MSIREKPFIDAVSRLGPLPGFLFGSPFAAGFFAIIMAPVFGGFTLAFWMAGHGAVYPADLFRFSVQGGVIALVVAALIFAGIAVSAFFAEDERPVRFQFVFGGACGAALLLAAHLALTDRIHGWLLDAGPIAFTSQLSDCR